MDQGPQLGRLIDDGERRRDAIHIAVAPVTATDRLSPGQHVGLVWENDLEMVGPCDDNIGIVDPFLVEDVEPGRRFWLFLYPGTVTGLRHVWFHPAFIQAAAATRKAAMNERSDFLEALANNENDTSIRLIYADWLDDHGEHEEADRQRKWPAAKTWLVEFCWNHSDDDDDDIVSYGTLLELGQQAIETADEGRIEFDCGTSQRLADALRGDSEDFWTNWSVITGIPLPSNIDDADFTCAC